MTSSELLLRDRVDSLNEVQLHEPATWRRLGREFLRSKKGLVGGLMVAIVLTAAVAGPVISPYSPNQQEFELANMGPTFSHPFGGDELGRDVLTRTLHGARLSIGLAVLVVAMAATIGTLLGALAGFFGGAIDTLIMRTTDFLLVFPFLLLAMLLVTIIGTGFKSLLIALCALLWLHYSRVVRAEALKLRELEFVQASRVVGSSRRRILFGHILPNVLHTVIVLATLDISVVIIAEAGLTYLGLGLQPPTPTWGGMIAEGQAYLSQSPWIMFAPAALVALTVIGINLFGDWLRDVLDPSLRVQ
jgi:ABC-type dipeptide/oligopeptide/nickel transport system permease subunit